MNGGLRRENGLVVTVPDAFQNRTDLALVVDCNFITAAPSSEMVRLQELHDRGWINLTRTDTMDTELAAASDDKRDALLEQSRQYVEHFGPTVIGHSRLGSCVVAGDEDEDRHDRVFRILFPGVVPATAKVNHFRDAMHVATAIRYGAKGFVTNERRLLNKDPAMREAFNNFRILSPADALALGERLVAKYMLRRELTGGSSI